MSFFDSIEEANGVGGIIPAGWYTVMATSCSLENTKSGSGKRLSVVFEIIKGEFKGCKIFEIFNVINQSELAQRIARSNLKSLYNAAFPGEKVFLQSLTEDDFVYGKGIKGKVVDAKVITEPGQLKTNSTTERYPDKNKISAFIAISLPIAPISSDIGFNDEIPF